MNRFSSSKLRIVWTIICLLMSVLAIFSIQRIGSNGNQIAVLGVELPLGFDDIEPYITQNLSRAIYNIVPAIMLLGGFIQLSDWIIDSSYIERYRGLLFGSLIAIFHGIILAQITIFPLIAIGLKVLGGTSLSSILLANFNAILLGSQFLLWSSVFGLLIKSNRGLVVFLVYLLNEIGNVADWCSEFLADLTINVTVINIISLFSKFLPGSKLPADSISIVTFMVNLSVPIVLTAILALIPYNKIVKRSRI